jgi:hypothetical protein
MLAEPRTHRIQDVVPSALEQVRLTVDHLRPELVLEHVPAEVVALVEPHRVPVVQTLHALREVGLARLHHEVEVVRHRDPGQV